VVLLPKQAGQPLPYTQRSLHGAGQGSRTPLGLLGGQTPRRSARPAAAERGRVELPAPKGRAGVADQHLARRRRPAVPKHRSLVRGDRPESNWHRDVHSVACSRYTTATLRRTCGDAKLRSDRRSSRSQSPPGGDPRGHARACLPESPSGGDRRGHAWAGAALRAGVPGATLVVQCGVEPQSLGLQPSARPLELPDQSTRAIRLSQNGQFGAQGSNLQPSGSEPDAAAS
jgi:hypothetical protein